MFYKPLNEVDLNDLQLLVSNKVQEGSQLDYKLKLPETNDKGKVDLLRDISAFANTSGGYLIYGIKEKDGVADKIIGVENLNFDNQKQYVENLVRTNIEPRLVGLEFHEITVDSSHTILIIKTPRSWNSPHVVSFVKHWRFYGRNSAGNYQMDVTQLKDSFILGSSITEKLEDKRNERLSLIKRSYQTGKQEPVPTLVIHIQPFESLQSFFTLDIKNLIYNSENLILGYKLHNEPKFNFDGVSIKDNYNYLQIFKSGVTEEVNTQIFDKNEDGEAIIDALKLDSVVFRTTGSRLKLLKDSGVDSPVLIQVSLLGIHNYKLQTSYEVNKQPMKTKLPDSVDRGNLITESIFLESLGNVLLDGYFEAGGDNFPNSWKTAESILKPALDSIWNAIGIEACLHYDKDGKWKGRMSFGDANRIGAGLI